MNHHRELTVKTMCKRVDFWKRLKLSRKVKQGRKSFEKDEFEYQRNQDIWEIFSQRWLSWVYSSNDMLLHAFLFIYVREYICCMLQCYLKATSTTKHFLYDFLRLLFFYLNILIRNCFLLLIVVTSMECKHNTTLSCQISV